MSVQKADGKEIGGGIAEGPVEVVGTTDWTKYTLMVDVPPETDHIYAGIQMTGRGKMWVDLEDVRFELVEEGKK